MLRDTRLFLSIVAVVILSGRLMAAPGSSSRTIRVDCGKGQSIATALADRSPSLQIELMGVCTENVTIERDSVTIRGIDGSASVIGSVTILHSRDVSLEGFNVRDGESDGIMAMDGSHVRLTGMTVRGHVATGFKLARGCIGIVADSVFDQNYRGISATESHVELGGTVACNGNSNAGILISAGTAYASPSSTITTDDNRYGIWVQGGSSVFCWGTTRASGNSLAGFVALDGSLVVRQVEATFNPYGADVEYGGHLELWAGSISSNGTGVSALEGAVLRMGPLSVTDNDQGLIVDAATASLWGTTLSGNGIDVALSFGAHVSFDDAVTVATPLECDGSVLTRGIVCPANSLSPAAARETTSTATGLRPAAERRLPLDVSVEGP